MRILITGNFGRIGSALHEALADHFPCGIDKAFGEDISEFRQVEFLFGRNKPEVCFHLASVVGNTAAEADRRSLWLTGAVGTRNIIDCCIRHDSLLVFASSVRAQNPEGEYDLCKWVNERQIALARGRGLRAEIVRLPRVDDSNLAELVQALKSGARIA